MVGLHLGERRHAQRHHEQDLRENNAHEPLEQELDVRDRRGLEHQIGPFTFGATVGIFLGRLWSILRTISGTRILPSCLKLLSTM